MEINEQFLGLNRIFTKLSKQYFEKACQDKKIPIPSLGKMKYLRYINETKKTTVSELANEFNVKKPTVTNIVADLESIGLVSRVTSKEDKRVHYLSPTKTAQDILKTENKAAQTMAKKLEKLVTGKNLDQWKKGTDLLVEAFEK